MKGVDVSPQITRCTRYSQTAFALSAVFCRGPQETAGATSMSYILYCTHSSTYFTQVGRHYLHYQPRYVGRYLPELFKAPDLLGVQPWNVCIDDQVPGRLNIKPHHHRGY